MYEIYSGKLDGNRTSEVSRMFLTLYIIITLEKIFNTNVRPPILLRLYTISAFSWVRMRQNATVAGVSMYARSHSSDHESDFRALLERHLPSTIPLPLAAFRHEANEFSHVGSGLSHVVFSFKTLIAAELGSVAIVIRVQVFPQDSTKKDIMTRRC